MALDYKYPRGIRDGTSTATSHAIFKPQEDGNTELAAATTYTVPANTVCIRIVTTTAGNINFPSWGDTADPGDSEGTSCFFPLGVEYMHVNPGMVLNIANGAFQICAME